MSTNQINPYSISSLIDGYLGAEEEDLLVKTAYTDHYIAQQARSDLSSRQFLDCTQRPADVQKQINKAFSNVQHHSMSAWGVYNGDDQYHRCGIDEMALLKSIIQDGLARGQKVFTLLDIGAGNFQWGRAAQTFISDSRNNFPKGITIHIISIRGEKNDYSERRSEFLSFQETDLCTMYEFGSFKIEDLIAEFKKREMELEGQVDMIVSRWCFPHLVDPLKTFGQAYNLLRPETGLFLGDGFYFFVNNQTQPDFDSPASQLTRKKNMVQLLVDLRAPVLVRFKDEKIDEFIVQRLDHHPCELDMRFTCLELRKNYDLRNKLGANTVCRYARADQDPQNTLTVEFLAASRFFHGSQHLYDWLERRHLIPEGQQCEPLLRPNNAETQYQRDFKAAFSPFS